MNCAAEGKVSELQQLVSSGAVRSLKVVDSEGNHCLNLAIKNKQQEVVQVGHSIVGRQASAMPPKDSKQCSSGDSTAEGRAWSSTAPVWPFVCAAGKAGSTVL